MSFQLTPEGKRSAERIEEPRDPETRVIAFMYTVGEPMEIEEIMDMTKMNDQKAVRVMTRLVNTGYVEELENDR